jgi:pimeloyl-ACP methyl ester carboxylesterase
MPEVRTGYFTAPDGVKMYYEDTGEGAPIVFVHEFAGDYRSWEPQVRFFSHTFRVITFNARGYPPSDCPDDPAKYGQFIAVDDVRHLLDHLGIDKAHVAGFSMGSFTALFFGIRHPDRARSVVPICCGYGAQEGWEEIHKKNFFDFADAIEREGMDGPSARRYAIGATRVRFAVKDPRGWAAFRERFLKLHGKGAANLLRYVVAARPSVYTFEEEMKKMTVPVLIITGDEDDQTLLPGVFMKRSIPTAGLYVVPYTGHTLNLEEPALFNNALYDFFTAVELGKVKPRDPRTYAIDKYLSPDEGADRD